MQTSFSQKSLAESRLLQLMLDRFLNNYDTQYHNEIRHLVLSSQLHALRAAHHWLAHAAQQRVTLLEKQTQLASIVVSQGGLNDAALSFLRSSNFESRLRASPAFAQRTADNFQSTPEPIHSCDPSFDPLRIFPCVVGSGRLAAAFLTGFQRLRIPNHHITIVSRTPLTPSTPLANWLRILLGCEPNLETYHHLDFDDNPLLAQPGPVFLLVKRKAFDDPQRRAWLETLKKRNQFPVVINLMAGGALNPSDERELVIRASVLVSWPGGGNLIYHQPQMRLEAWQTVEPLLRAMGKLLPVFDQAIQAKLTFFTSTLPLVFLAEIDRVSYRDLPEKQMNRLVLQTWAERYHSIKALLEGQNHAHGPTDPLLEATVLQYMDIYLGCA